MDCFYVKLKCIYTRNINFSLLYSDLNRFFNLNKVKYSYISFSNSNKFPLDHFYLNKENVLRIIYNKTMKKKSFKIIPKNEYLHIWMHNRSHWQGIKNKIIDWLEYLILKLEKFDASFSRCAKFYLGNNFFPLVFWMRVFIKSWN